MISVIIPTHNGSAHRIFPTIPDLLSRLRSQTIPVEIIFLDSSGTDALLAVAEKHQAKVIRIDKNRFDHGGSRTLGAKAAAHDIIVFMTHDAIPADKDSLEKLIAPFHDPKTAIVYGRQIPLPGATTFAAHLRYFNYPETSSTRCLEDKKKYGIKTTFLSNAFAAYRKNALKEIGWFKDKLILCEDVHAGAKILLHGYKIAYAADACVYHSHDYTVGKEFKRYFDIGVFHEQENWILKEFGVAEGEGNKYLKSGVQFLAKHGKSHQVPAFVARSAAKYVAYGLGRKSKFLPKGFAKKMSMHTKWWNA